MTRKKSHKYAVNLQSGEAHKLSAVTGACHLPDDAKRYYNIADVKADGWTDRCARCFPRLIKPSHAVTDAAEGAAELAGMQDAGEQ
jgi:hypothetical protein